MGREEADVTDFGGGLGAVLGKRGFWGMEGLGYPWKGILDGGDWRGRVFCVTLHDIYGDPVFLACIMREAGI